MRKAFGEQVLSCSAKFFRVDGQQGTDILGDRYLLGGAGKLLKDVLQAAAVVAQQQRVRHAEGFAGGLGCDERVAVAVAANP